MEPQRDSHKEFCCNGFAVELCRSKNPFAQGFERGLIQQSVRAVLDRNLLQFAFDIHHAEDNNHLVQILADHIGWKCRPLFFSRERQDKPLLAPAGSCGSARGDLLYSGRRADIGADVKEEICT